MTRFVLLMFILAACGPSRDLKKAQRLIDRAIAKGAEVRNDTIFKTIPFKVSGNSFSTTITSPNWQDTVYIKKDSIQVKIFRQLGKVEKMTVEVTCPDKTITAKIPVLIDRTIKAGYTLWELIILAAVAVIVGVVIGQFWRIFARG